MEDERVWRGPLKGLVGVAGWREGTHGQRELSRIPSRAWTIASSLVIASTAPCSLHQRILYRERNRLPLTPCLVGFVS